MNTLSENRRTVQYSFLNCSLTGYDQGCTNPGHQVTQATNFVWWCLIFAVVPRLWENLCTTGHDGKVQVATVS